MPQPALTGTPPILQFGGLALPSGQGTMSLVNLNDLTNWFWMDWGAGAIDDDFMVHLVARALWRSKGTFMGQDAGSRFLTLPMRYSEASASLGAALGVLSHTGLQRLTFDSTTSVECRYSAGKRRTLLRKYPTFLWSLDLEFLAPTPYFQDNASTTIAPVTLNSGAATNFNVTYAGSVWTSPVWTLAIPNSTVAIAALTIANTMSGETLTISFPGSLPAATAATITIDTGAMTVTDAGGRSYDVSGTAFPLLYGPAGTVQQIQATLIPASGTAVGCTIAGSYQNRWLI